MSATLVVDIVMPTYNHETFVAQAIESVLAQQTNFEYRLNIGDDYSSDNTRTIISGYAQRHPDRIRAVLSPHNIGILHEDRLSMKVLKLCTAKYVAWLEGDDYWTDPCKLQKQVDFLESRPDCVICFHNALLVYEDGSAPPRNMLPADQKEISTIEDLFKRNFIPTCSLMFKRGLFGELPRWFFESPTGDWLLHLLNAEHGLIGYINEVMAAYRIHGKGLWSQQGYLTSLEKEIEVYETFKAHFSSKYPNLISDAVAYKFLVLAEEHASRGNLAKAKSFALKSFSERLGSHRAPSRDLCSTLLRLYVPGLHKALRTLKMTMT